MNNKTFHKYLPLTLIAIIIIAAIVIGFMLLLGSRQPESQQYVINPNAEVIKKSDQVKTIQIDSAGGKKEMVQVRFEWEVEGIKYNDAINVPKEEYEKLSQQDLEKLKQERFNNWMNTINEQSVKSNQSSQSKSH